MKRREIVRAILASVVTAPNFARAASASALEASASKIPSVVRMSGAVTIDGVPASGESRITSSARINTGDKSEIVFVVGTQVIAMRENTVLELQPGGGGDSLIIGSLRLLQGAISSVSRNSMMELLTSSAAVGIRGTGFHVNCSAERTYFCTCYGATRVASTSDSSSRANVKSTHHDRPLWVLGSAAKGKAVISAKFMDHTDDELIFLEKIAGRKPPFVR